MFKSDWFAILQFVYSLHCDLFGGEEIIFPSLSSCISYFLYWNYDVQPLL